MPAVQPYKTYILTADIRNPYPDRRVRYDWRKYEIWVKGTRFHGADSTPSDLGFPVFSGRYPSQKLYPYEPGYGDLVAQLTPVEDFDALLHEVREEYNVTAGDLLRALCEADSHELFTENPAESLRTIAANLYKVSKE